MDCSKSELAKRVAAGLEYDLARFVPNLENGQYASVEVVQSSALTEVKLPKPVSPLGDRLMKELLAPLTSDIRLKVCDTVFLCHKEVLSRRCDLTWADVTSEELILENVKPMEIVCLLCFVYGGSIEMPEFCPLSVVAHVADVYSMSRLAEAVNLYIATELCHSFHKPCKVCTDNFGDALKICSVLGESNTLSSILKWNVDYFCTLWYTNGYYQLPSSLRKKCLTAVKKSLHVSNVVDKLIRVERFLSSITRVTWRIPVVANASELLDHCCFFIADDVLSVVENKTIFKLFKSTRFQLDIVDRILLKIKDCLTTLNACEMYLSFDRLHYLAFSERWDEGTLNQIVDMKKKLWSYLLSNYCAIIHTRGWDDLKSIDRRDIMCKALWGGDVNRKLCKKPILSSTANILPLRTAKLCCVPKDVAARYRVGSKRKAPKCTPTDTPPSTESTERREDASVKLSLDLPEPPQRPSVTTNEEITPDPPILEVSNTFYLVQP